MCAMCMPAFLLPASRVYKRGRILAIGWAAYGRVSCKMCLQSWTCPWPQCMFKESACKPVQCLLQALTCTRQNSVWLALTIACLHLPVDVVLTMPSHSLLVLASVSCEPSLLRYSIYSYHYSLSPVAVLLAPTLPGRSLLALASVCCKSRHESWIEVAGSSSRLTHHPIDGQMGKDDSACPSGDAIIIIDRGQRAWY